MTSLPFRRLYLFFLVLLFASAAWAQRGSWALEERPYYDFLLAEPRAATVKVLFPARSEAFPFMIKPGSRLVWDISLGKELPIVGYETASARGRPFAPGKWGVGFWLPISFHMIEDFKDDSAPIVNTDYRFGGMVKFRLGLPNEYQLGARFVIGHESTHLGDEFTLAASTEHPDFERINVSYEYWQYGLSIEKHFDSFALKLRHGGIGLLDTEKGFYQADLRETGGRPVPGSKLSFEPSFGVELLRADGLFSGGDAYFPF